MRVSSCLCVALLAIASCSEGSATLPADAGPDGPAPGPDAGADAADAIDGGDAPVGDAAVSGDAFVLEPPLVEFPETAVSPTVPAPSAEVRIVNPGPQASGPLTVTLAGDTEDFAKTEDSCGPPLPPGGHCVVTLRFRPTAIGERKAMLVAAQPDGAHGTAVLAGIGVSGASLAFGSLDPFPDTALGTSLSRLYTVANSGAEATGPLSFTLTGDTGDFALDPDACVAALPAGDSGDPASCTFKLTFAPKTLGTKMVSLQVSATPGGVAMAEVTARAVEARQGDGAVP
jgi:hypothetical protein